MQVGQDTSGSQISAWFEHIHRPQYPQLMENSNAEVCIIGGGILGLTTAYQLLKAGKKIILIEDGRIGSGETGRTSAHLTNVLDDRYFQIEAIHGKVGARLAAESHTAALRFIEKIVREENIDCDYLKVDGHLFLDPKNSPDLLEKELTAASQAGLRDVQLLEKEPANTFKMKGCLLFPHQAQFHPLKYLNALSKLIEKMGGSIYELTRAVKIKPGKTNQVITDTGHTIKANHVVVATNVPFNDRVIIHTKQAAYRTYIIGAFIPKNTLKPGLYWDTADPYHYIRLNQGEYFYQQQPCDLLIIGGEDHRVGESTEPYAEHFRKLESWSKTLFPTILSIEFRWSGQVIEPVDHLAFIGHNPLDNENIFIGTGDSGNGLTHGTLAALLLSDLILKKENPWTTLYNPKRKSIKTAKTYLKENLNTASTYLKYLTTSDIADIQKMANESGKIINKGLNKIAIYKDDKGNYYECSAICPHLKSIVQWNSVEKTWDCPAHGSRFSCKGELLNGPSNCGLSFDKISRRDP